MQKLLDWLWSSWRFALTLVLMVSPFLGLTALCLLKVQAGQGLQPFRLGMVDMPRFLGAGASYLDVLLLCLLVPAALLTALLLRYRYYRDERDFLRRHGLPGRTGFWGGLRGARETTDTADIPERDGS